MVARVVSQDVIELNIVDFVGSSSLESLLDDTVLLLRELHLEVVKDGAEPGEGNKARPAPILVLELWLD